MQKGTQRNAYGLYGFSLVLIVLIASAWLFHLDHMPGLHGDEASVSLLTAAR